MKISVSELNKNVALFGSDSFLKLAKRKDKYIIEVKEHLDAIDIIFRFFSNLFGTECRNIAQVLNSAEGQDRLKRVRSKEVFTKLEEINNRIKVLNKKFFVITIPEIHIPKTNSSSSDASPSPSQRTSPKSSPRGIPNELLVPFYQNAEKNSKGHTLKEIWGFSLDEKEENHRYIQWLFPTFSESNSYPDAPRLTPATFAQLKKSVTFIANLKQSLEVMLEFFGLKWNATKDEIRLSSETQAEKWVKSDKHNHLRITRILDCLKEFGLIKENQALFACLEQIKEKYPSEISNETWDYWSLAACPAKKII